MNFSIENVKFNTNSSCLEAEELDNLSPRSHLDFFRERDLIDTHSELSPLDTHFDVTHGADRGQLSRHNKKQFNHHDKGIAKRSQINKPYHICTFCLMSSKSSPPAEVCELASGEAFVAEAGNDVVVVSSDDAGAVADGGAGTLGDSFGRSGSCFTEGVVSASGLGGTGSVSGVGFEGLDVADSEVWLVANDGVDSANDFVSGLGSEGVGPVEFADGGVMTGLDDATVDEEEGPVVGLEAGVLGTDVATGAVVCCGVESTGSCNHLT